MILHSTLTPHQAISAPPTFLLTYLLSPFAFELLTFLAALVVGQLTMPDLLTHYLKLSQFKQHHRKMNLHQLQSMKNHLKMKFH